MQRNLEESDALHNSVIINTTVPKKRAPEGFEKIKDTLFLLAGHWKWFVIALSIALAGAYYYLQTTPYIYQSKASVMIKADDNTYNTDEVIKSLGLKSPGINITNEVMTIKTLAMTQEVVNRLGLDVECFHSGPFHDELAYGIDLPVKIRFLELNETDEAEMDLEISADSTVRISSMRLNHHDLDGAYRFRLGKTVQTPLGTMSVTPSLSYVPGKKDRLKVVKRPMRETLNDIDKRIIAGQRNAKASIIDFSIDDISRTRGEDILSTLINVYNENWVKDRNRITHSTTNFINERLAIIEQELGNVESDISSYKSRNLMPDVNTVGGVAFSQMNASQDAGREIQNQISMTKYLRNYITDGLHDKEQLPVSTGIDNASIERQVQAYNELLLQRNNHLAVSSEQNPLVMDIDQKLSTMKSTILGAIDNELTMLNTRHSTTNAMQAQAAGKLAANPEQARHLLSFERQQKVKESIYLFLLQRREENELSQAFTAYNTRIIDHPRSNPIPVSPDPIAVTAFAIIFGLAVPASVILVREGFNTTVRGRKDLEELKAPFIGEIPLAVMRSTSSSRRKGKKVAREITDNKLIVKAKSKSIMNEAFRVVRTNLEFILGFESGHHIVMMTSMNPGSGKTFITANLSTSLAIKGKKVVAVDLDLRRGSLSKYVDGPAMGVSNYLSGQIQSYHEIITRLDDLDVIPVGTIPPNPTELLFTPRFTRMMEQLKEEYDYVFIDCPPVEIVADAAIISRYVEMTIFVVRAHLLDRAFLHDIQTWYEERRFPNLSILLNGTHEEFSNYGYSRYGYHRYGYHYGHYGEYGHTDD